jgi:diacylglycerol kinase family enzyme
MKHVFVFDPKAFRSEQWKMDNILDNIGQFFRTQDKPDFSIQFSRYRRNAISLIQNEIEKTEPDNIVRVYAIGDEEILYDCLNFAAHFPNVELAAVPYGETNDFLSIFGKENLESFRDIPLLVTSNTLPTDIIRWGVNYALNSCYIGMNTTLSQNLKNMQTNLNKGIFIIFSKISSLINYILTSFDKNIVARKYTIEIDDVDYSGHYSLIHVANGSYHAGKKTGADAVPDDGFFDITLIKSSYALKTIMSLGMYSRGKKPRNGIYLKAKKITVQSDNQMWIQMDNEYIQDTKISMDLINHAVSIVTVNNLSYPLSSMAAEQEEAE